LKILVLEGLDWSTIVSSIDFWPKSFTVRVSTGLIGIDPFPAFLLLMSLFPAEDTGHLFLLELLPGLLDLQDDWFWFPL
jgi:hypothetical protein